MRLGYTCRICPRVSVQHKQCTCLTLWYVHVQFAIINSLRTLFIDCSAHRCLLHFTPFLAIQTTWSELHREVRLLSSFLQGIPALRTGDRLGVLGRNSAEYLQVQQYSSAVALYSEVNSRDARWTPNSRRFARLSCGAAGFEGAGRR